jgi:hypothetical protein
MTLLLTVPHCEGVTIVCDKKNTSKDGVRDGLIVDKYYVDNNNMFVILEWNRPYYNYRLFDRIKDLTEVTGDNIVDKTKMIIQEFIDAYKNPSTQYGSPNSTPPIINVAVITCDLKGFRIETQQIVNIVVNPIDVLEKINGFPKLNTQIGSINVDKKYFRRENAQYLGCAILDFTSTFDSSVGASNDCGIDILNIESNGLILKKSIKTPNTYNLLKCFKKLSKNITVNRL